VHSAGVDQGDGVRGAHPWFSMELVHGAPLNAAARRPDMTLEKRLDLLARTCEAVAHAHLQGIVHRDLKPANILVDDAGLPHVLDFGIAVTTGTDDFTRATRTGDVIGTLNYMSPEQASGHAGTADARADVHALGVIGFELLSGRLPFDLDGLPLPEIARRIAQDEAPNLATIDPTLRGGASAIIAKALEKSPARRYADAGEMGADLRRLLADEPLVAQPITVTENLRRAARRHRAVVAGALATILALAIGLIAAMRQAVLADRARAEAVAARESEARSASDALVQAYRARVASAAFALANGDSATARVNLDQAPQRLRGWEWRALGTEVDQSDRRFPTTVFGPAIGFSPDGRTVVARGTTVASGVALQSWDVESGAGVTAGESSTPAGTRPHSPWLPLEWVDIPAGADSLTLVDFITGAPLREIPRSGSGRDLQRLHTESSRGDRRLVELEGRRICACDGDRIGACVTVPDDRRPLYASIDPSGRIFLVAVHRELLVYETSTGRLLARLKGHDDLGSWRWAWAPDGSSFVTAAQDGGMLAWDARTLRRIGERRLPLRSAALAIAFSPDGRLMAVGGFDGAVRLLDRRLEDIVVLRGHARRTEGVAFSPDGTMLASLSADGLRLWNVEASLKKGPLKGHESYVYSVAVLPDGRRIVSLAWDGTLGIWDVATRESIAVVHLPPGPHGPSYAAMSLTPDGTRATVMTLEGALATVDLADARIVAFRPPRGYLSPALSYSPTGTLLAATTESGMELLDASTLECRCELEGPASALAWDADGRIASAVASGRIRIVDAETCSIRSEMPSGTTPIVALEWDAPRGRLLAIHGGGSITSVDPRSGRVLERKPIVQPYAIALSPDGSRIAAGTDDSGVILLDADDLEEIARLPGHSGYVHSVAWSSDGTWLASGSGDGTIRIWR